MISKYYQLTKPGIIYGNLLTATAGFFLASRGDFDSSLYLATLLGISLVIASACVFNNYIDRNIDKRMTRTKKRALVSGDVSGQNAIIYAIMLAIASFACLAIYTNPLTVGLGCFAMFVYVVLYGIFKRRSVYGTIIGSVAGALPPVAGYTAVTNQLDVGAFVLFLILVFWQMPHFYSIAIYRLADYKAAGLPVLPIKKGVQATKNQMILYIIAFIAAVLSLNILGYAGAFPVLIVAILGLFWLKLSLENFGIKDDMLWARKLFLFSLVVITSFSLTITASTLVGLLYNGYMFLVAHIIVALSSIVYTSYLYFRPSRAKLNASYALVVLTIISGTYLVWQNQTHLVQACLTGLVYLGCVAAAIIAARNKLASVKSINNTN